MKKIKQLLAVAIAGALIFGLAGCAKFNSFIKINEDGTVEQNMEFYVDKELIDQNSDTLYMSAGEETVVETIDGVEYYNYYTLMNTESGVYNYENIEIGGPQTVEEMSTQPGYNVTTGSFYVAQYKEATEEASFNPYADVAESYVGTLGISAEKIAQMQIIMVLTFPEGKEIALTNGEISSDNSNQVVFDLLKSYSREGDENIQEIYAYCTDATTALEADRAAFDAINIANAEITTKENTYLPEFGIDDSDVIVMMNGIVVDEENYYVYWEEDTDNKEYVITVYGSESYTGQKTITVPTKKGTPALSLSKKKAKQGKLTYIEVQTDSYGDIVIKGANSKAKKAIKSKKIEVGYGLITITKKAAKGTYKFKVTVKKSTSFNKRTKTFKVTVK